MSLNDLSCLHSLASLQERLPMLGQQVCDRVESLELEQPVLALTVLNGGLIFSGMLLPYLSFELTCDYIHASRYRGEVSASDDLQWFAKPSQSMEGRCVLLLDDIFDEGITLKTLVDFCYEQGACKVITVCLADKQLNDEAKRQQRPNVLDFSLVKIPDVFVVGLGMDYQGLYRNKPGIFQC